ncbi:MAG: type II toxin-antitoxin system RelB/DinJ family antitoxin [Deltaproteobacteria bacterium]|nr:type II toxin-antitoxin system RelB/DinJ family antitoxin [Deltaproteobacteria bacterium]
MANSESIHVKMDPAFKEKVDAYCKAYGVTMSEAVRASLRDVLTQAGYFGKENMLPDPKER